MSKLLLAGCVTKEKEALRDCGSGIATLALSQFIGQINEKNRIHWRSEHSPHSPPKYLRLETLSDIVYEGERANRG
jgi:hypothetical protein